MNEATFASKARTQESPDEWQEMSGRRENAEALEGSDPALFRGAYGLRVQVSDSSQLQHPHLLCYVPVHDHPDTHTPLHQQPRLATYDWNWNWNWN